MKIRAHKKLELHHINDTHYYSRVNERRIVWIKKEDKYIAPFIHSVYAYEVLEIYEAYKYAIRQEDDTLCISNSCVKITE